MLKENKGITLVALIITIIVMLILAAVSISLVVGENGVLTQAQSVEPAQVKASLREAIGMVSASSVADYYTDTGATFVAKTTYKTKYGVTGDTIANATVDSDTIANQIGGNFSYSDAYDLVFVPFDSANANPDDDTITGATAVDEIDMSDADARIVWAVVVEKNGGLAAAVKDPSQTAGSQIVKVKLTIGQGTGTNGYLTFKAD